MEALVCKNCGGAINRETYICPYCGTVYKKPEREMFPVIEIEHPRAHTLTQRVAVGREVLDYYIESGCDKDVMKMAIDEMAGKFADALVPFMDTKIATDLISNTVIFESRIRVLDPKFRF